MPQTLCPLQKKVAAELGFSSVNFSWTLQTGTVPVEQEPSDEQASSVDVSSLPQE